MNFIDIILAVLIFTCTLIGYKKGFINSFSNLVKWVGAFTIALLFYLSASPLIKQNFAVQDQWQLPLSFLIVFIFSFSLLSIAVLFVNKCFDASAQKNVTNRIAGIIPGFAAGIIAAAIISKLLASSFWMQVTNETKNSMLCMLLDHSSAWVSTDLNNIFNTPVEQKISGASEAGPGMNQSDELRCSDFYSRPDFEEQLLQLVNAERIKHGIKTVIADIEMQQVANEHARDMYTRGYFSHNTPEGTDPFERMKKAGIDFMFAGENLAHSSNLFSAHKGLMQSPGHRANILNPAFGKLGIIILDGGPKGLMIVQEFRD